MRWIGRAVTLSLLVGAPPATIAQPADGVLLNPAAPAFGPDAQPERLPPVATPAMPIATPRPADAVLGRPLREIGLNGAPAPEVAAKSLRLRPENRIASVWSDGGVPPQAAGAPAQRFGPSAFAWAAPAVYHRPLLFEQPNLERYGHHHAIGKHDVLTPSLVSAAHFFGASPAIPYWMGAYGACEHRYTLGSYRPGSCNPHQLVLPRASLRGVAAQAAATTGMAYLIP